MGSWMPDRKHKGPEDASYSINQHFENWVTSKEWVGARMFLCWLGLRPSKLPFLSESKCSSFASPPPTLAVKFLVPSSRDLTVEYSLLLQMLQLWSKWTVNSWRQLPSGFYAFLDIVLGIQWVSKNILASDSSKQLFSGSVGANSRRWLRAVLGWALTGRLRCLVLTQHTRTCRIFHTKGENPPHAHTTPRPQSRAVHLTAFHTQEQLD